MNEDCLNGAQVNASREIATASGALVSIEQDVQLRFVASGAIVSFEQAVKTIGSGAVISIHQLVVAP